MTEVAIAHRHLIEHECVWLDGACGPLHEAHLASLERYRLRVPPPDVQPFVHGLLDALVLWATSFPDDTSVAWSILLPSKEWRLFASADGRDGTCVARWSPFEAEHRHHAPLFDVQTQRQGGLVQRSLFEPETDDLHGLLALFFEQSQQTWGRLRRSADGSHSQLFVARHGCTEAWRAQLEEVSGACLPEEDVGRWADVLAPRRWTYGCGCDPTRLQKAFTAAAGGDVAAVFGDDPAVDVECPRCGREHRVERPSDSA